MGRPPAGNLSRVPRLSMNNGYFHSFIMQRNPVYFPAFTAHRCALPYPCSSQDCRDNRDNRDGWPETRMVEEKRLSRPYR